MSEVNCIKTLRNEKGLSITEIAKTMQINWCTAKKYGDGDQLPQEKTHLKKDMMYDEKWGGIVIDWLEEDLKLKKKSRRKNKKIYEDLVKDVFKGSYRTVCNPRKWNEKTSFYSMARYFKGLVEKLPVVGHSLYTPYLPTRIKEYLTVPSLVLRKQRINELLVFSIQGEELLFQIISEFYEQKSLIITSNLEFSQWNRIFSDSRLTNALSRKY